VRRVASVQNGLGVAEVVATFDNMLLTDQKGNIEEASIIVAAVKQSLGINRAKDYEFAARLRSKGP
jgi:hypothetical protein